MKLEKINATFPYNGNQKRLHVPEKRYLEELEFKVRYSGFTGKKKKEFRDQLFAKVKEIKDQDPHPAKVLGYWPGFFWDYDLYWVHWKWHRQLIIPRMLQIYEEEHILLLEEYYTAEEIITTMKQTREFIFESTYPSLSRRYSVEIKRAMEPLTRFF